VGQQLTGPFGKSFIFLNPLIHALKNPPPPHY